MSTGNQKKVRQSGKYQLSIVGRIYGKDKVKSGWRLGDR